MDPANETASKGEQRAAVLLVAIAAAVLAAAVWSVPIWLGNDGPAHLFNAYVNAHYHDEAKGFARYFELNRPVTVRGFLELYRLFDQVVPWQQAYRLTLVVMAELWAFAFLFAATSLHRARWPIGLCGFALALGWALDMGFFSFWLATAGALATVGISLRFGDHRWVPLAIALGLWMTACVHVFPTMLAGVSLVVIEAARRPAPQRWLKLAALTLAGVPAAAVALSSTTARGPAGALEQHWGPLTDRLTNVIECTLSGPWWRQLPVVLLAIASLTLLLARRRQLGPVDAAVGGMGLVLLALTTATPLHLQWMFFSTRFAPLGMAFLLMALPCEQLRAPRRIALAAAAAVWVVAACHWSAVVHRRIVERVRPALELSSTAGPSPTRRLTVVLPAPGDQDLDIRYVEPWRQVGQLVALERGGITLHGLFGVPAIHPLLVRAEAFHKVTFPPGTWAEGIEPAPGPARRSQLTRVLAAATGVDELVLVGRDEDIEQLVSTGFRASARAPGVAFASFQGCSGQVIVEGAPGTRVAVDLGWWPLLEPAQGLEGVIGETGSIDFGVDSLTCEDVWLRVQLGRCANGDQSGYVRGRLADGPLRCQVGEAPP